MAIYDWIDDTAALAAERQALPSKGTTADAPKLSVRRTSMGRRTSRNIVVGLIGALAASGIAEAMPFGPLKIPVARLVRNLEGHLKKDPNDVQAVFTLGRVHYFAFAGATDQLNVDQALARDPTAIPDLYFSERGKGEEAIAPAIRPLTGAERVIHLKKAVTYLMRAVTMKQPPSRAEGDGRYELCLACAFEEGAPFAAKVGPVAGVAATRKAWTDTALRNYGIAFEKSVDRDIKGDERPTFGLSTLVSYEAGKSYQRLIGMRGTTLTAEESSLVDRITQVVATMNTLPRGSVTPLIFSLDRTASLANLLSDQIVRFDLNGSHLPQRYQWVLPNTAILVWDPDGTGHIVSGRQLFGSVTWWMFWDDAYQALAALDDDGNGWLEGYELADLALWFDRNVDGVSDRGEVVPVTATPIVAIAARATGRSAGALMNAMGLLLRDGRTMPTYDWVPTPR